MNSKRTIRYYSVRRNGRGFWEPTKVMRALGFGNVPCGRDGPAAWAIAEEWNRRWDATRTGQSISPAMASAQNLSFDRSEELTIYPQRSIGAAFREYRRTDQWGKVKKARTREDWWRGWRYIKPVFGDCDPRTVKLQQIDAWRSAIVQAKSLGEAHRAVKIWRALWKVAAAMGYCGRDDDPSLAVRNSAPKGRSATWSEGEAARLAKRAWRMGYYGLAAVVGVAWDTQLSPGDVRALRASQMATNGTEHVFTERGKTGKPVGGALSVRSMRLLAAYLEELGTELHGEAFIFRNRSGQPYTKDTLGDDFRTVRAAEFGPLERRMLGHDFRRSGAVEAISGEATPAALSHAMGNTLATSNKLFATYVPVNIATINSVAAARRKGRSALR